MEKKVKTKKWLMLLANRYDFEYVYRAHRKYSLHLSLVDLFGVVDEETE